MKRNCTFFALSLFFSALVLPLMAQETSNLSYAPEAEQEVVSLTKAFEDAYNRGNAADLGKLFTPDAERTDTEGTSISGNSQLVESYAQIFKSGKWQVKIRPESTTKQADGSIISTGSYKVTGTDADGTAVTRNGTFRNEIVRKNKQLLIRRMKLHAAL